MRILPCTVLALLLTSSASYSQEHENADNLRVVERIKAEAFDNSQVMDTAQNLTDRYGPRLTGSPEWREAADWTVQRLRGYGLENVHLEKWGTPARSWSLKKASLEMLQPRYSPLVATPLAWSDVTHGAEVGEVILAPYGSDRRTLDPKQAQSELDTFMAAWKGKLKGKIVLLSATRRVEPATKVLFQRDTAEQLSDLAAAPEPVSKIPVDLGNLKFPPSEDAEASMQFFASLPPAVRDQLGEQRRAITAQRAKFLKNEGVLAILQSDARAHDSLLFAEAAGPYDAKDAMAPATFVVTQEQYNRIVRLLQHDTPVKVRVDLQAEISPENQDAYNIVADIPGVAKKDELVMLGAHFDSWHTGTGATDNAAGSVAMIEAMRILKALDLKLDRTVRLVLWSGEEEGLLGSKAYVKEHFGDPATMKVTAEHAKVSGYFNLDNGSGKIRGVYLQGNDAMRPLFAQWLSPFHDEGVTTVSIRNTGGTDHLSFDAVGLPGFQFIQDPLDYGTLTHHSDMDTYDHLQIPDLMQASAVIASVVYDAANRPDMLPRKQLPRPWKQ